MNNNQNNQYYQNNTYNNNKLKKSFKDLYPNTGYGSSGTSQQTNNYQYQYQYNMNNFQNSNGQINNHYPIQNNLKEGSRPLWSYREIKYDQNRMPMNSEEFIPKEIKKQEIKTTPIPKKENIKQFQERDKKYFNNSRYQKVTVTKKVKNSDSIQPMIQKKGPEDDYEQKYSIQNYENMNVQPQQNINNNNYLDNQENYNNANNQNDEINNLMDNYGNEDNEGNEENENENEDDNGEIELDNNNYQKELDKIIDEDDNNDNENYNNNNEEQNPELNNMKDNVMNEDDLEKENYEIDPQTLAEVHSEDENEEKEYMPNPEKFEENENKDMINKDKNKPRPAFMDTITQNVTDFIDDVKTFPEGNLESWNYCADYNP